MTSAHSVTKNRPEKEKKRSQLLFVALVSLGVAIFLFEQNTWASRCRQDLSTLLITGIPSGFELTSDGDPAPQCTEEQMTRVRDIFLPGECSKNTRCPHPTWIDEHLYNSHVLSLSNGNAGSKSFLGITFGCNKGDDAVGTLAKFTGNPDVSIEKWRHSFAQQSGGEVSPRGCPDYPSTWLDDRSPLSYGVTKLPSARMFCVEASKITADTLKATADSFGRYNDTLTITYAAMGIKNGIAYFPKQAKAGMEWQGICDENWPKEGLDKLCDQIPMITADKYLETYVDTNVHNLIDILSVDVEGFDWDVLGLGGANQTLKRTKYLEFEYHGVGNWPKYNLSMVTTTLFVEFGLVCYYAGIDKLWRLTNCFQEYFEEHDQGNVACVNPHLNADLAVRMESNFQRQLV